MWSQQYVRVWVVELNVLYYQPRCLTEAHSCIANQSYQPTRLIIQLIAESLYLIDIFDWDKSSRVLC